MILDPQGNPTRPRITDEQLVLALKQMHQRSLSMSQQIVHLGLFTEYLYDQLARAVDEKGMPLIQIDMEAFPGWAEIRYEEMQNDATQRVAEMRDQRINLNE